RAGGGGGVVDVDVGVGVEVVPPAEVVGGGGAAGVGEAFGTVDAGVVFARVVVVPGGCPAPSPPGGRCGVVVVDAGTVGAADVESCCTKGSLLLNRPNDSSWFESRWTTMRSVSGSLPGATGGKLP